MGELLSAPAGRLDDPVQRGTARLLAVCLGGIFTVLLIFDATLHLSESSGGLIAWAYGPLAFLYILSRTRYYRWGALGTSLMFALVPIARFCWGEGLGELLYFSAISPFVAGLFLGVGGALALAIFNPIIICALPALVLSNQGEYWGLFSSPSPLAANLVAGIVAVSYAYHRDWVELRRVHSKREHEAQMLQMQKMEALGRMAGGIAHDFNNLLTVISGGVELLARKGKWGEIKLIESATNSAQRLTSQLLTLSRQGVVEHGSTDLRLVLRGVHELLSRIIGEDIEVCVAVASDVHCVKLEEGQIQQVLLNLATNARDAMPRGGILSFSAENLDEDHVSLAVTDTGKGMEPAVLEKIFEPFFTTKDVGKGTGLGMSMVFGLVTRSGGTIQVDSELGVGTCFRITLCRAEPVEDVVSSGRPRLHLDGSARGTILLVEDDSRVRELCRFVLRREGYSVIEAAGPQEALALFDEVANEVDLLISDVVMPVLSGPELVATLQRKVSDLPVLFMSGYAPEDVPGEPLDSRLLLRKPFRPTELIRRVSELLYNLESRPPPPLVAEPLDAGDESLSENAGDAGIKSGTRLSEGPLEPEGSSLEAERDVELGSIK